MKEAKTFKLGFLEIGYIKRNNISIYGISVFDKYCYTSYYGFETLKK